MTKQTPKLPNVRDLASMIFRLHEAWSHPDCGPERVALYCEGAGWEGEERAAWTVGAPDMLRDWPGVAGDDSVGGDRANALAVARRLLAKAKKAGF